MALDRDPTSDSRQVLLAFEGLVDRVRQRCFCAADYDVDAHLDACVITAPVQISEDEIAAQNRRSDPRLRWASGWFPTFWSEEALVSRILDALSRGIRCPSYWTIGYYESAEVVRLVDEGLLDPAQRPPAPRSVSDRGPRKLTWLPVVVQWQQRHSIWFPDVQGMCHMPGAAVAICEAEQGQDHFPHWMTALSNDPLRRAKRLLYEVSAAPPGTLSFLAPYGDENREHAVIAHAHEGLPELVSELAASSGMRLVRTRATEPSFWAWEVNQGLPPELGGAP